MLFGDLRLPTVKCNGMDIKRLVLVWIYSKFVGVIRGLNFPDNDNSQQLQFSILQRTTSHVNTKVTDTATGFSSYAPRTPSSPSFSSISSAATVTPAALSNYNNLLPQPSTTTTTSYFNPLFSSLVTTSTAPPSSRPLSYLLRKATSGSGKKAARSNIHKIHTQKSEISSLLKEEKENNIYAPHRSKISGVSENFEHL